MWDIFVQLNYYSECFLNVAGPVYLKGNLELMRLGISQEFPTSGDLDCCSTKVVIFKRHLFGTIPRNGINCRYLSRLHLKHAAIRKPDAR